jgi:hypothetical protein
VIFLAHFFHFGGEAITPQTEVSGDRPSTVGVRDVVASGNDTSDRKGRNATAMRPMKVMPENGGSPSRPVGRTPGASSMRPKIMIPPSSNTSDIAKLTPEALAPMLRGSEQTQTAHAA